MLRYVVCGWELLVDLVNINSRIYPFDVNKQ